MAEQLTKFAVEKWRQGPEYTYFPKLVIEKVQTVLTEQRGQCSAASSSLRSQRTQQQRRGVGGTRSQLTPWTADDEKRLRMLLKSDVMANFKIATTRDGAAILLYQAPRSKEHRPVVSIEELPSFIELYRAHGSGYAGINKTYNQLAHHVVTKMDDDVALLGLCGFTKEAITIFLQDCPISADQAPLKRNEQPRWHAIHPGAFPFHHEQVDLLDLGEGRDSNFRYVLIMVELKTRHVWGTPLPSKSALLVARWLNFMWGYLQVPDILHSDNGMEFCAEVVKGLCELWGVQQRHGSIGKPSTQGCVERINKTFKAKLSAQLMVSQGGLAWPFHVQKVLSMINDEPCEVFGNRLTRSQALFGAPNRGLLKPEVEKLAELLQFSSSQEAVCAFPMLASGTPAAAAALLARTGGRKGPAAPTTAGKKRPAPQSEVLSDEEGDVPTAALTAAAAVAQQRTSRRKVDPARMQAVLAFEREDSQQVAPTWMSPRRAATAGAMQTAAAAAATEQADDPFSLLLDLAAAAEDEEVQARPLGGGAPPVPPPAAPVALPRRSSRTAGQLAGFVRPGHAKLHSSPCVPSKLQLVNCSDNGAHPSRRGLERTKCISSNNLLSRLFRSRYFPAEELLYKP